ncbi:hypothetical protein [Nonlabens agnitus]|uniref:Uncharacterized protein n=1 Tax=Nonlabens agnitus TaxID=870484 RepID=A0A2S9WSC4_9FLAO|nr:hypothetical protein [Nonlabens agnitus]PRP66378.1 hypothetical protein BST86_04370 [Nonlabens agnitus]
MKNYLATLVILLMASYGLAQKVGDSIPQVEFNPAFDLNGFEFLPRVTIHDKNLINPKKLEEGKKYDRIEFTHYGKQLWFSAKCKKNNGLFYEFKNASPFKYVENDAPFAAEGPDKNGYIPNSVPIYHGNGQLWYEEKMWDAAPAQHYSSIAFNEDGSLYRQLTYYYGKQEPHPIFGEKSPGMVTPVPGYTPNYQTYPNGVSYMGYQHVGTLYTSEGWEITGFMTSLRKRFGNGGVFFIANRATNLCYWATLLNYKIISIQPADCTEKPDIQELNENWDVNQYNWDVDAFSKSKVTEEAKQAFMVPDEHWYKKWYFSLEVLEANAQREIPKDGYHVKVFPVTNRLGEDGSMVEIGMYKNGKLHGQGFTARIDYYPGVYNVTRSSKSGEILFLNARWDLMAGTFENGNFKQGRKFSTENAYSFDKDIFTEPAYDNYDFVGNKENSLVTGATIGINEVSMKHYVYIKSLKRVLSPISVDKAKGVITVQTDRPGTTQDFIIADGDIYAWDTRMNSYKEACPTVKRVPVYREKKVLLYTLPGEVKRTEYRVAMMSGTKVNSSYYVAPGKEVYGTKSEVDHYETQTCPICKGTGVLYKSKQSGGYAKVVF